MADKSSQIVAAVEKALTLLRFVDSLSPDQLASMREDGLINEEASREVATRTDASDFRSLISFVEVLVPGATREEIIETLATRAAVEIAEGGARSPSITQLLKSAPGIH
jgi:hypothetical protein